MGYWMLKNIVTLKLHKGSFKLQGHSKALVQFRIPYQLWPYLWLFQHNTRTWQTHRHLLTSKAALMHCIVWQTGANRLTQVHLSSTRFTWVHLASPGFTQVHLNSPRFTWLHLGSSGFTWVHPASPGFTQVHLNSPGFTWLRLGSSGFTWVHLGSPGFTWVHLKNDYYKGMRAMMV